MSVCSAGGENDLIDFHQIHNNHFIEVILDAREGFYKQYENQNQSTS